MLIVSRAWSHVPTGQSARGRWVMRLGLDLLRLVRSLLSFGGHYRVASVLGILLAVGWIVFATSAGSYADDCSVPATATACGTEDKPYVVKPPGVGAPFKVAPDTGAVFDVEVSNWPTASGAPASTVELSTDDRAFMLLGFGLLIALGAANLISGWGRSS